MSDVEKSTESTGLAVPDDLRGVGMEDVDSSDIKTPRLKIKHQEGLFVLHEIEYESLDCVVLGMFKQRVMWQPKLEENAKPICRSFDFKTGFPNHEKWSDRFAGSVPADVSQFGPVSEGEELPCNECGLKEFRTHPISEKAPWCAEQHVYPLIIVNDGQLQPALLTLAKTGLAPSRNFLQPFVTSKLPMFTQLTNISLNLEQKGGNTYSVPAFRKIGETDRENWHAWADQFRTIKGYITTPRSFEQEQAEEQAVAEPTRARKQPEAPADDSLWDEDEG